MYSHPRSKAVAYSGKHNFVCERDDDFVFRSEAGGYFAVLKKNKFQSIAAAVGEAARRKVAQLAGAPSSEEAWREADDGEGVDDGDGDDDYDDHAGGLPMESTLQQQLSAARSQLSAVHLDHVRRAFMQGFYAGLELGSGLGPGLALHTAYPTADTIKLPAHQEEARKEVSAQQQKIAQLHATVEQEMVANEG
jgi:hypothetical protein